MIVNGPVFRTADLGAVGTVLQVDVFLPAGAPTSAQIVSALRSYLPSSA
jgi:Ni,Fe-hydrogenase III small subunit